MVAALVALVLASAPQGEYEGVGRVTLGTGWRYTPNDTFYADAQAAGAPRDAVSPGGPAVTASFAYAALDWVEVALDPFVSAEQLHLVGVPTLNSVTYGIGAGARLLLHLPQFLGTQEAMAFVGVLTGPTLVNVSGGHLAASEEHVVQGYIGSLGLTLRFSESWGATIECRLFAARGAIAAYGSVNGGGAWMTIELTHFFARQSTEHDRL